MHQCCYRQAKKSFVLIKIFATFACADCPENEEDDIIHSWVLCTKEFASNGVVMHAVKMNKIFFLFCEVLYDI